MPGIIKDSIPEGSKSMKKPCKDCPFSRTVKPGALGGSPAATFVGQGHGPFYLPCHKTCDFDDPNWKDNVTGPKQCAGAAMYRANIERAELMPNSLLKLPKSDLVFGSPEELFAHHQQVSIENATLYLSENTPEKLMVREIQIAQELQKK